MRIATGIAAAVASSLKLKLILIIVAILALTIGIAPWRAIKIQQRQLLEASQERLRSLHEMLREAVIDTCMLTGEREAVQRVLETVSSHADIESVRLFDTTGVIRYSSRAAERGQHLSHAELERYYGRADAIVLEHDGGTLSHTLVQPVFNQPACFSCHPSQQKVLGILQVSVSLESVWRQLASLKRSALVANLITLGVIVIGIWLSLTWLVDRPLQELVGVMGRTERGDLSARVGTRGDDELGKLARHFNDMIAKLHVARQELERYHHEQLARAERLATIGEMAAAIAHEIRNPLTGISGALSVLGRGFPSDDPRREVVRETHHLIDRLNRTVQEILHYSRPALPQFQAVALHDIVNRTMVLVEGEARKARVDIVRINGHDAVAVRADPHQLQQVLMNLLLNAIQATPPEGRVSIRLDTHANGHETPHASIEIGDNGKGMSAEEAAKAFQPFFSTKTEGTGLGLPIAKRIVEQHGGRIHLDSTLGKGTSVRVELPVHPEMPDPGV